MTTANNAPTAPSWQERSWPSFQHGRLFDFTDVDFDVNSFVDDGNISFNVPTDLSSLANTSSNHLLEDNEIHVVSSINATNTDLPKEKSPNLSDLIISPNYTLQYFEEIENERKSVPQLSETLQSSIASTPGQPSQRADDPENLNVLHKEPVPWSDTPEMVKQLFDNHLWNVLSIKDDRTTNPWRIYVWPIAGRLVRDALDKHRTTRLTGNEMYRLNFLARTWMYKDVMIRLTTSDDDESVDLETMTACTQLYPLPEEQQLDPLLGCATTLFPLIGRLTDIIKSVRRRTEKHNSPSIISKGAELRMAIEGWSPSFDPQRPEGLSTPHISDVIQTAEAHRWAALLLLRQAVPELPWAHSIWELAEKVSIYLATTPVTSRTMIIQTFPLMAIGGEAFDQEDRNWVCERWDFMSKRMPLARLDKCKRVTKEVWRRRDVFEAQSGTCPSCGAYRLTSSSRISPTMDTTTALIDTADLSVASSLKKSEEGSRRCQCSTAAATRITTAPASNFPDSLAFKKGVDNITRAGNLHYTVRGDLHRLEVMKDWNWEGEFHSRAWVKNVIPIL
ncbi:uncharacterized protein A1O5_04043 [Cladophialophora psammophila CBS 110553]|uniref:Uncharacterized protein n=1 Tax=Cladophialophora psammophila CBS 110553 TaxID=1182543 RepID=W9X6G0_9EURO|nr:uncharacterized protein A1O5_04043 [Cladophialophora psammophila CBS 110553]EXJ72895.1 hypothetical protein A1O5_04043 [Cladophialophora psammophila CBS 110553]